MSEGFRGSDELTVRILPIACPKCAGGALIEILDLDRQMRCRHCLAWFYVGTNGHLTIGSKPPKSFVNPYSPVVQTSRLELLPRAWKVIPRPFKLAFTLSLLVPVALWFAWGLVNRVNIPQNLDERSEYVVKALVSNDLAVIKAMSAPGTSADAVQWLRKSRPPSWNATFARNAEIETEILFQNATERIASVVATITSPQPPTQPLEPLPTKGVATSRRHISKGVNNDSIRDRRSRMEILLSWRLGSDSLWYLDGQQMLRNGPPTASRDR